jgi:hypothetical protein
MEKEPKSWWHTMPGILTAISGLIAAVTSLIVVLHQTGIIDGNKKQNSHLVSTTSNGDIGPINENAPITPSLPAQDYKRVEKLSRLWAEAVAQRNVEKLVEISSPPFLFFETILANTDQIRRRYQQLMPDNVKGFCKIKDVQRLSEWMDRLPQPEGRKKVHDMQLKGDDLVALVCVLEDCEDDVLLFFRKQGSELKMAGIW